MKRLMKIVALGPMLATLVVAPSLSALAQAPVDDQGNPVGDYRPAEQSPATGAGNNLLLPDEELEKLVGPIALYPDDLLAIVLPASAYPLQIVEAARFLDALESDRSLKPDPEWDDSVVALLNYPEVVRQLNDDIDWTSRLGEAVVSQQGDVVAAIESFRDRAYAAGNLKSDEYQNVTRDEGVIEITPVSEDVIYVPYYEPERVVVYQPRPVYYYYPRAYPVYYYPYPASYYFDDGFFWGVTTAFTIGWLSDSLHVYHHSYYGHPYYGHHYYDRWWYRRPSINIYNTTYLGGSRVTVNHYYRGDRWQPRRDRREYVRRDRETRNRYYPARQSVETTAGRLREERRHRDETIRFRARTERQGTRQRVETTARREREEPIRFRARPERQEPRQSLVDRGRRDSSRVERGSTRDRVSTEQGRSRQQPIQVARRTDTGHERRDTTTRRRTESAAGVTRDRTPVVRPERRSIERAPVRRAERSASAEAQRSRAPEPRQSQRRSSSEPKRQDSAASRESSRSTGRASREGRDRGRERRR